MEEVPGTIDKSLLETQVKKWLARFLRLVLWEPSESMKSFMEVLSPYIVSKLEREIPNALRKGRLDDLGKRAFRWIEELFWDDIRQHPNDVLNKRTLRLKRLFDNCSRIPPRTGDSDHFPISVFIEYDSLLKALKPTFKRRPAKIRHLPRREARTFVDQTLGGGRGYSRRFVLEAINEKRLHSWETEQLQRANRVIPFEQWPKGKEFWFKTEEIGELTPSKAALKILAGKMELKEDTVWKLVKEGKRMLPPGILERLEAAYATVKDNSSWQFLNQIDPPP